MADQMLTRIARASGTFAMVAVDQREALRGMFAVHHSDPVPDSMLAQFKVDVAEVLSPYGSALLVDEQFGLKPIMDAGVLNPNCGLIVAMDELIGPAGGAAVDTAIDHSVDPVKVKEIGGAALKLLIFYRPDDDPEVRLKLAAEFIATCNKVGLPSVLEIICRPGKDPAKFDREQALIDAAAEASTWQPSLYKAEVPYHGKGDPALITEASKKISDAIGTPWVVLSNGVAADDFASAVKASCLGGASGFLAGRAIWSDVIGTADYKAELKSRSISRLTNLCEIVDEFGKPFTSR
jgi:sulfofructosephosphate aldolase